MLVVTPGVLLRRLHDDPFLEGVACVVFDEFHERGLDADLALGMVRLIRETVRPELMAVVMSATIDPAAVSAYFGGCPVVDSAGRTFPVDVTYRPRRSDTPVSRAVADAVRDVLSERAGDVLAFLPGLREIRQTADELKASPASTGSRCCRCTATCRRSSRTARFSGLDRRKVVLATNVAETSVTVDGRDGSGRFAVSPGRWSSSQASGWTGCGSCRSRGRRLTSGPAAPGGRSRACACGCGTSRATAGGPNRLCPKSSRVDLCGAVLQLAALGEPDVRKFPWLDAPQPKKRFSNR